MDSHRIGSFRKELSTYGDDISTEVSGNNVIMTSGKNTNLREIQKDLEATAAYYKMKMKRIDENIGEFVDIE